jgi:8-oxo-dGTP pyrophosphatase MutT (NUDIX family)
MSANLIQALISQLPRYAEEEGDFYSVPREDLINALCHQHRLEHAIAENTIALIETLLDTLAVLNTAYLQKGEWCFISFPAQLLATSILTAMSDNESRFFADNFWNTQDIADAKKNQQREVLSIVENQRYEHHASHKAKPVRYIYVAWGIIKLDGNILFYQREDTRKRFDKKAGDYGLIGGRLNQHDVPGDMPALLAELQSEHSALIKKALPETLKREIREESGLIFEQHYRFKPWRSLKPYRQVQGSAPNHALTEYYLDIFQVELTLEGYLFLQQQIKRDDNLVWFAIEDVVKDEAADDRIAYVKALVDDFDKDHSALKTELLALPDSFTAGYLFNPPKSEYGLTLLMDAEKPLLAGVLGKAKPIDVALTPRQSAVLLGLAAHGRGFEFATVEQNIIFHPYGWIDVKNNPTLQAELKQLAELFKGTDLIIESHHDVLFRLSINPDVVYFDEALFTYSVHKADLTGTKTKIPVSIERKALVTALGITKVKVEKIPVTLEFAHKLQQLSEKQFSSDNEEAVKIEDTYKKGLHKEPRFSALGLRGLIRREAGIMKFVLPYTST